VQSWCYFTKNHTLLYSIPFVVLLGLSPLQASYLSRKAEGWHWYEKSLSSRPKKKEKRSEEGAQEALQALRDLKPN
jgi:hypothetical protein